MFRARSALRSSMVWFFGIADTVVEMDSKGHGLTSHGLKAIINLLEKTMKFFALTLIAFLAGCAPKTWYHPTASESQFRQESALCERTASVSHPETPEVHNPYLDPVQQSRAAAFKSGQNFGRALALRNTFENCMAIKGYYSK